MISSASVNARTIFICLVMLPLRSKTCHLMNLWSEDFLAFWGVFCLFVLLVFWLMIVHHLVAILIFFEKWAYVQYYSTILSPWWLILCKWCFKFKIRLVYSWSVGKQLAFACLPCLLHYSYLLLVPRLGFFGSSFGFP